MMSEQMAAQMRAQAAAASDRPTVVSEPTHALAEAQRGHAATSPLLAASKERVVAALNAHGRYWHSTDDGVLWRATCACGTVLTDVSNGPFFDQRHRAHVAEALLASEVVVPDGTVLKATPTTPQLSTPTEIIDQRAAGDIDDDEMMAALLSRSYSPGKHDPTGGDGYIRGTWSEIERALGKGLLSDDEYERIARGVTLLAEAWGEGYLRGTLDSESDLEPADNPYRTGVSR